jgi:hypothetical protein
MMCAVSFKSAFLTPQPNFFSWLKVVLFAYSVPQNWTHKEGSSLLGCDAMLLGEQFQTFGRLQCLDIQDQAALSSRTA